MNLGVLTLDDFKTQQRNCAGAQANMQVPGSVVIMILGCEHFKWCVRLVDYKVDSTLTTAEMPGTYSYNIGKDPKPWAAIRSLLEDPQVLPFIQTSIILKNGRGALSSLKNDFVQVSYRARVLAVESNQDGRRWPCQVVVVQRQYQVRGGHNRWDDLFTRWAWWTWNNWLEGLSGRKRWLIHKSLLCLLGEIGAYSGHSVKCLCRSVCSLCSETPETMSVSRIHAQLPAPLLAGLFQTSCSLPLPVHSWHLDPNIRDPQAMFSITFSEQLSPLSYPALPAPSISTVCFFSFLVRRHLRILQTTGRFIKAITISALMPFW